MQNFKCLLRKNDKILGPDLCQADNTIDCAHVRRMSNFWHQVKVVCQKRAKFCQKWKFSIGSTRKSRGATTEPMPQLRTNFSRAFEWYQIRPSKVNFWRFSNFLDSLPFPFPNFLKLQLTVDQKLKPIWLSWWHFYMANLSRTFEWWYFQALKRIFKNLQNFPKFSEILAKFCFCCSAVSRHPNDS